MPRRIVIAGGGFGGFYAVQSLEKLLTPASAHITLVSEVNYLLYTPLLPGAAAGTLEPRHVVVPLREELHHTDLHLGKIVGLDKERQTLKVSSQESKPQKISYDHLIVALGSVSRTLPIKGLAEHAIGFKTLAEAIYLRNRVIEQMELAESCKDSQERREHLGFVFVGGGYAGLEAMAELHDFATELIDLYPRCRLEGMRWLMVEASETILPEIGTGLARFAMRQLEGRGIEFRTNTTLASCDDRSSKLSSGEAIAARTLVWTAGVEPNPVIKEMGLALNEGGRIAVSEYLNVAGEANIWALGDGAAVPNTLKKDGQSCPPTAQHAIRQGRIVARNVAAALGVGSPSSFKYKTRGVVVDLGRHQAVVSIFGIKLKGFFAWWLTRTYHLVMLPGLARKLRLMIDWTIGLLFGRDASELGTIGHPPTLDGD